MTYAYATARLSALLFALKHDVANPWRWSARSWETFSSDPDGYQWWASSDEETYSGPYATRDEAIRVSIREEVGYAFNGVDGCQRFYLLEARQGPVDLASHVSVDDLIEEMTNRVDEEFGGEDGLDWDFWTADQERELDRDLELLVRCWQRRHRIRIKTWTFTHQRGEPERYTYVHPDSKPY